MHESSLIRTLMAQVRQIVETNGGGVVRQVRLQVGPRSGVEPMLMASVWEQLRTHAALGDATLAVEEIPLVAECQSCTATFEPIAFCFRCPSCGGTQTETIRGDGVVLHSIVLDDLQEGAT